MTCAVQSRTAVKGETYIDSSSYELAIVMSPYVLCLISLLRFVLYYALQSYSIYCYIISYYWFFLSSKDSLPNSFILLVSKRIGILEYGIS